MDSTHTKKKQSLLIGINTTLNPEVYNARPNLPKTVSK